MIRCKYYKAEEHVKGTQGLKGDPGEKGETGSQGIPGEQGLPGADGSQGLPGVKGDTGDQGYQGIQGEAGTPGSKGDKGDPGDAGTQGIQGIQGETGPPGTTTWVGITDKPSTFPPDTHNHDNVYEAKNANIQTHVISAHAPSNAQKNSDITKAEIEAKLTGELTSHTHAGGGGGLGYTLSVQALTSSPGDGATVYFGQQPKAPGAVGLSKVYIRKAGTIKMANILCQSGTAGTAEAWSLYIRKNNSADTLIATLSVSAMERVFTNSALNIAVAAGDYVEIKSVQPTWATNPLTTIYGGYLYIE